MGWSEKESLEIGFDRIHQGLPEKWDTEELTWTRTRWQESTSSSQLTYESVIGSIHSKVSSASWRAGIHFVADWSQLGPYLIRKVELVHSVLGSVVSIQEVSLWMGVRLPDTPVDYHTGIGDRVDDSRSEPHSSSGYVTLDSNRTAAIDPIASTLETYVSEFCYWWNNEQSWSHNKNKPNNTTLPYSYLLFNVQVISVIGIIISSL